MAGVTLRLAALLGVIVAGAISGSVARAEVPATAEAPRIRPGVLLDMGLGGSTLNARWVGPRPPDPDYRTSVYSLDMAVRTRVGVAVSRRFGFFVEGRAEVPAPPTFLAWPTLAQAGVGVGGIWFLRENGPWYVELGARRAWAKRFNKASNSLVLIVPRPVDYLDEVWLAEVGIGRARDLRSGGHTLSLFGGLARPSNGSGWLAGIAYIFSWSTWGNEHAL